MSLLELKGVGKRFGGLRALDDVSFAIETGEMMQQEECPSYRDCPIPEWEPLGIRHDEHPGKSLASQACTSCLDAFPGQVHSDDRAPAPCEADRVRAGPASQVEHPTVGR